MQEKRPLIGIPADRRVLGPQPYHLVGEKYLTAILDARPQLREIPSKQTTAGVVAA